MNAFLHPFNTTRQNEIKDLSYRPHGLFRCGLFYFKKKAKNNSLEIWKLNKYRVILHLYSKAINHNQKLKIMFIARYSAHINQDIVRNWSSWNFGQEGFEGTYDELQNELSQLTDENPFWVSGFDIYPAQKNNFKFGELYANYWVAIDNRGRGLSCHVIEDAETLEQALEIVKSNKGLYDGTGDGDFVDCSGAKIVYSETIEGKFGLHILEIQD